MAIAFDHPVWLTGMVIALNLVVVLGQNLRIEGYYLCIGKGNGVIELQFYGERLDGTADRFLAVRPDGSDVDPNICSIQGSGTSASPYILTTSVNVDTGTGNDCGANVTALGGGVFLVVWTLRGYPNDPNSPIVSSPASVTASCRSDELTSGVVRTEIRSNIPLLTIVPRDPGDATGDNSIVAGANMVYRIVIYPQGNDFMDDDLQNRAGYYPYVCETATNVGFTPRNLVVNSSGCIVETADFAPITQFRRISSPSVTPIIIEADGPVAQVPQGGNILFLRCFMGYCTDVNDDGCDTRCGASDSSSRVDANVLVNAQITIQEVQGLTFDVIPVDQTAPRNVFLVGEAVNLQITGFPNAADAGPSLQNANGLHVGNCQRSFTPSFTDQDSLADITTDRGCRVTSGDVVIADEFTSSTNGNFITITSGDLIINKPQGNNRVYLRCPVYACTGPNDSRCVQSCSTTGTNGNFVGNVFTSYSIIDPNEPSVQLQVVGGATTLPEGQAILGDIMRFQATIIPQNNQNNAIVGALGAYLYSCSYARSATDIERVAFIDDEGCVIDGFLSAECRLISPDGQQPFVIDCGEFYVLNEGESMHLLCTIGVCFDQPNAKCSGRRCGAGSAADDPNAQDTGIQGSSLLTLVPGGRTAQESEPLRTILAVISGVGGVIFISITMAIAWLILRRQKNKLLQEEDAGTFGY